MRRVAPIFFMIMGFGLAFIFFGEGVAGQLDESGQAPRVALGSGFTYQGRLDVDGAAANGEYDFQFRLYDTAMGGSQAGVTVSLSDVQVVDGLFSVVLDFDGASFDGEARWLDIAVREGTSDGPYTTLSPRQQLNATPYALHALQAGSVQWSDVQNRPAGLDDGDDDTTYTAGAGLVLNGSEFSGQGSPYGNVVVVAKSGGDFSSIQTALDSITDASVSNPYLVYVAPGIYEERVLLKPFVTVEGAGEGVTVIRWTGGSQPPWEGDGSATMVGADDATVRQLTVENDGTGHVFAVGVYNNNVKMTLTQVTASAWDADDSRGVANYAGAEVLMHDVTAMGAGGLNAHGVTSDGSTVVMRDVRAVATGGNVNYAVLNWHSGSPTMLNVSAQASGATSTNYGVFNNNSSPNMNGGIVRALDGQTNRGIYNWNGSSAVIQGVRIFAVGGANTTGVANLNSAPWLAELTISAAGGTSTNEGVENINSPAELNNITILSFGGNTSTGIYNDNSSPQMMNVNAAAVSGSNNYGLYNAASSPEIRHSVLEGSTNSIYQNGGGSDVAYSQLLGPVTGGLTCLGNYDADLNAVVCP